MHALTETARRRLEVVGNALAEFRATVIPSGHGSYTNLEEFVALDVSRAAAGDKNVWWTLLTAARDHEYAHLRYTSKKIWQTHIRWAQRQERLFQSGDKTAFPAAKVAIDVLNILEDSRIERAWAAEYPGAAARLSYGNHYHFNLIEKSGNKVINLLNAIIYQAKVGDVPAAIKDKEIIAVVHECTPYLEAARTSETTQDARRCALGVLKIIQEIIADNIADDYKQTAPKRVGVLTPQRAFQPDTEPLLRKKRTVLKPTPEERPDSEPGEGKNPEISPADPEGSKATETTPEPEKRSGGSPGCGRKEESDENPEEGSEGSSGNPEKDSEPEGAKKDDDSEGGSAEGSDKNPKIAEENPGDEPSEKESEEIETSGGKSHPEKPDEAEGAAPCDNTKPEDGPSEGDTTDIEAADTEEDDVFTAPGDDFKSADLDWGEDIEPLDDDSESDFGSDEGSGPENEFTLDPNEHHGRHESSGDADDEFDSTASSGLNGKYGEPSNEGPGSSGGNPEEVPTESEEYENLKRHIFDDALSSAQAELEEIERDEMSANLRAQRAEEKDKIRGLHDNIVLETKTPKVPPGKYNELTVHHKKEIRELAAELQKVLVFRKTQPERNRRKGIVDGGRLWKVAVDETSVFYRRKKEGKKAEMTFYLLVDMSGSMKNYDKTPRCTAAALICASALQQNNIPFSCTGFATGGDNGKSVVHSQYVGYPGNGSLEGIAGYAPDRENRDGYSIRIATKEILSRPERHKILIVLSDGLPSHKKTGVYYAGDMAVDDTIIAVREAERAGVIVIGIYIEEHGGNIDTYKKMYPRLVHVHPQKLPAALGSLLSRIIKNI